MHNVMIGLFYGAPALCLVLVRYAPGFSCRLPGLFSGN